MPRPSKTILSWLTGGLVLIMMASTSIPAFFPPQYFEVEAGGGKY